MSDTRSETQAVLELMREAVVRPSCRSLHRPADTYRHIAQRDVLCEHCYAPYHAHAAHGDWCPVDWPVRMHRSRFSPLLCQYERVTGESDSEMCGVAMAVVEIADDGEHGIGGGYCLKHFFQIHKGDLL